MRKPLIIASLAASALTVGGLAGAAQAASPAPEAAPPTIPDIPIDQVLSMLTPEQLTCMIQNMGVIDPANVDMVAAMELLTQCGVSLDQFSELDLEGTDSTPAVSGATEAPVAVDPAAIAAVLELIGLDATDLGCLSDGLAATTLADDAAALAVLQGCEISLSELLAGLVAAQAGAPVTPTTGVEPTTAAIDPTATVPAEDANDVVTNMLLETFESMGMSLTEEQAGCIAEQVTAGSIDANDQAAVLGLLEECGVM